MSTMVMQNRQILVPLYEDLPGDPDFLSTYKMRFFQQKSLRTYHNGRKKIKGAYPAKQSSTPCLLFPLSKLIKIDQTWSKFIVERQLWSQHRMMKKWLGYWKSDFTKSCLLILLIFMQNLCKDQVNCFNQSWMQWVCLHPFNSMKRTYHEPPGPIQSWALCTRFSFFVKIQNVQNIVNHTFSIKNQKIF